MASSPEKQELIGGKLKKVKLRKRELPTAEKAANEQGRAPLRPYLDELKRRSAEGSFSML